MIENTHNIITTANEIWVELLLVVGTIAITKWIPDVVSHIMMKKQKKRLHRSKVYEFYDSYMSDILLELDQVSRAYIVEYKNGEYTKSRHALTHLEIISERVRGDITPIMPNQMRVSHRIVAPWEYIWRSESYRDYILMKKIDDETDNTLKYMYCNRGVKFFATCPLFFKGDIVGYIALDFCNSEPEYNEHTKIRNVLKQYKDKIEKLMD